MGHMDGVSMMQPMGKTCPMEWTMVYPMGPWRVPYYIHLSPWCAMEHTMDYSIAPDDASVDILSMGQPTGNCFHGI